MGQQHLLPTSELINIHANDPLEIQNTINSSITAIADVNSKLNAVVWQDQDFTNKELERLHLNIRRNQAENSHTSYALIKEFPLLGIPILVKEIDSAIAGVPNSWGNIELKESRYKDTHTANKIKLLQNAGAIIVGKTNNSELAITLITNSDAHGPCINPLDNTRNTLGSSGGSAASVASAMVNFATGGDGGGSIRMPAAACGIYGFKPSRGRISKGPELSESCSGIASSGAFTKNTKDMARIIDVMSAFDAGDIYSASPHQTNFLEALGTEIQPLNIGIRIQAMNQRFKVDPFIQEAVKKVGAYLQSCGHIVEECSPLTFDEPWIIEKFETIIAAHTKQNFGYVSELLGRTFNSDLLTPTSKHFYEMGEKVSLEDFMFARQDLEYYARQTNNWFNNYDILITPTIGDFAPGHDYLEEDAYIYSANTFPGNIAGLPGLSIPVKTDHQNGLPCGVQIYAQRDNDELALNLGQFLESDYSDIFITESSIITS